MREDEGKLREDTACSFFINRIQTERRENIQISGAAVRCPPKCPGFLPALPANRFHPLPALKTMNVQQGPQGGGGGHGFCFDW